MVALLHGWGGQAAQLTSFVPPLLGRGFSVVAFDAPGHGASSRGMSSAPQFARALSAVASAVGGRLHGVVAHSLGGAAAALAIRDGLGAERVVFVAPPADPPQWVHVHARGLGLDGTIVAKMRARSERRIGLRWDELKLESLVAGFRQPLLVIHDRHDAEVPLRDGAAVAAAWPGARLLETEGLGHNRILRDPAVVAEAVAFLSDGLHSAPCSCIDRPAGVCAHDLERHLFDREGRLAAWGSVRASWA
jgi:pimeloyl-ACP methyl ester carboxylesterase